MHPFWTWLTTTSAGLMSRIAVGGTIFLILAIADLRRNGDRATRWREYLFLLSAVAVAMVYGAINDLITSRISWEYFYYGKELMTVLGPTTPPSPGPLARQAALIGIKATWTAGMIVGVGILLANNPKPGLPQLPYRRLLRLIPAVFLICVACGALLGLAGYFGWLTRLNGEFPEIVHRNLFRPFQFMAVFGVHLGGYVGGAIGTILAIAVIRRGRHRLRDEQMPCKSDL